jgi:hypothetical protein
VRSQLQNSIRVMCRGRKRTDAQAATAALPVPPAYFQRVGGFRMRWPFRTDRSTDLRVYRDRKKRENPRSR